MAKNKNPATMSKQDEKMWKDLGLDNFDGGFESFNFDGDFQDDKESRSPTLKLASSIGGSLFKVGKSVVGGAAKTIGQKVLQALPETESIVDSTSRVINDLEELKDKTRESARPFMNTMARVGKKMLGQAGKIVPTSIEEKLQAKLKELEEATEEYKGLDEKEERRLAREKLSAQILAEVFSSQAKERIEDKKTAAVKEAIDSRITTARFNKNIEVLDDIRSNSYFQTSFLRNTMTSYMRKDLELKYKQFYLAEDTLGTLVNMAKMQEERLDAIIHNSSLPDSQKVYMTEIIKRQMREKTLGGISNKLSDIISNSLKGLYEKTIKPFLDSSAQALNMVGLASDLTSSMGGGNSGLGGAVLSGGMDLLGSVENNRIWNKIIGKVDASDFKNIDRTSKLFKRYTKRQMRDLYNGSNNTIIHKLPGGEWLADLLRTQLPDLYNRRTVVETKDLNQYNDAANLTNRTIETIEEIIPGYLAKMNAHLETIATGRLAEERIWDTQKKDFVTMSAASAKITKAMFGDKASQNITALQSISKLRAMNGNADYLYNGALDRRFAEDHVLQKNVYLLACNLANSTNIHEIDDNAVKALRIIAEMGDAGQFNEYVTRFAADAFGYNIHDEAKVQTAAFLYNTFVYRDGRLNSTTIGEFNDLIDDLATQYATGRAQAESFSKLGFGRVLNNFGARDVRGNLNVGGEASLRHINRHVNADNIARASEDVDEVYIRVLDRNHPESDYDMSDPRTNRFLKRRSSLTLEQIRKIEKENEYIRKKWKEEESVKPAKRSAREMLKHPLKTAFDLRNIYEDKIADVVAGVLKKVSDSAANMSAFGIKGKNSKADTVRSILGDIRGKTLFGVDTNEDDYSVVFKELKGVNSGAIEEFRNRMLANNPSLKFLRAIDDKAWKHIKQEVDDANKRIKELPKGKDKDDRAAAIKREADRRIDDIINSCVSEYTTRLQSNDEIFDTALDKDLRNETGWYGAQLDSAVGRFRESKHQLELNRGHDDGFVTETGMSPDSPVDSMAMQQLNSMLRIENILRAWRHLPQIPGVPGFTSGSSNLSYASIARTVGGANAPPAGSGEAITANRRHEEVNEDQVEQPETPAAEEPQYTEGVIGENGFKTSGFLATPVNLYRRMKRFIPGNWGYNNRLKMNNSRSFKEAKKLFRGLRDAEHGKPAFARGILGYRRPIDGSNNYGNYAADMDEMPLRMDMGDGTPAIPVLKNDRIIYINERLVALLVKQELMASFDPDTQVIIGDNDVKHLLNVVPGFKWFGKDNIWRFRKSLGYNVDEKGNPEYVVRTAGAISLTTKDSEDHKRDRGGRIGILKSGWKQFKADVKSGAKQLKESIWHREATPKQLEQLAHWRDILTPRDEDNLPIRGPDGKPLEPYWDRDTGHNVCYVKWSDGKYHRELIDDVIKVLELLKSRNNNKYENAEDAWEDYQWMVEHNESINMFNTDKKRFVRDRTNFLQRMFKTKRAKQAEFEANQEFEGEKQRILNSEKLRNERKEIAGLVRRYLTNSLTPEDENNRSAELAVLREDKTARGWTLVEMNTDAGVNSLRDLILTRQATKKKEIRGAKEAKDTEAKSAVSTAMASLETEKRIGTTAKRLLSRLQDIDNDEDLSIEEREAALQDIIQEWNNNKDLAEMDGPTRARILQKLNRTRVDLDRDIDAITNDKNLSFTDKRTQISELLSRSASGSDAGAYSALISMMEKRFGSSFNGEDFSVSHEERSEVDAAILDSVDIGSRQLEILGIINDNVANMLGLQLQNGNGTGGGNRRGHRGAHASQIVPRFTTRDDSGNVIRESEVAPDVNEDRVSTDEKKTRIIEEFVNANSFGSEKYADVLYHECLRAPGWNDPDVTENEFINRYNNDPEFRSNFIAHARDAKLLEGVTDERIRGAQTLEQEDRSNAEQKKREMLRKTYAAGERFDIDRALESGVRGTLKRGGRFAKEDAVDTYDDVKKVSKAVWKSVGSLFETLRDIKHFFTGTIDDLTVYDKPLESGYTWKTETPDTKSQYDPWGPGYYGENTPDPSGHAGNNSSHMARGGVVIDANDNLRKYGGVVTEPTNIAGGRIQVGEAGAESVIPHRDNQRFKDLIINAVRDTMGDDKADAVANALSDHAPIKRMAQGGTIGKGKDSLRGSESILRKILDVLTESKEHTVSMDANLANVFGGAVDATGKAITGGTRAMGNMASGITRAGGKAVSGLGGLLSHIPIVGGLLGGLTSLGGKAISGASGLMKLPWTLLGGAGKLVSGVAGTAGGLLSGITKLGFGGLKLGGKALAGLSKAGFGIMGLALKPLAWLFGGLFGGVSEQLNKIIELMGGKKKRKGSYEDFQEKRDKDGDGIPDAKEGEKEEKTGILGKLLGGLGALFGFGKGKGKGGAAGANGEAEGGESGGSALETAADAAILASAAGGLGGKLKSAGKAVLKPFAWLSRKTGLTALGKGVGKGLAWVSNKTGLTALGKLGKAGIAKVGKSVGGKIAGSVARKVLLGALTGGVATLIDIGATAAVEWLNERDNPKEMAWKQALYKAYGCVNNSDYDFAIKDLQRDTWEHLIANNDQADPAWVQDRVAKFGHAIEFYSRNTDDRKQRQDYLKIWYENRFMPVFKAWAYTVDALSSKTEGEQQDASGYPDVNRIPSEDTSDAIEAFNKSVEKVVTAMDNAGIKLNEGTFATWKKKHDEEELIKRASMSEDERFEYDLQNRDLSNKNKNDFGWHDDWEETKTKFSESATLWKEGKYVQSILKGLSGTGGAIKSGVKALFSGVVSFFTGIGNAYGAENENTSTWLEAKRKLYGFDDNEQLKYGKKDDIDKALDEFELDQRKIIDNERPPFDKREFDKYITKFLKVSEILKLKDYFKAQYDLEVTKNLILQYFYTWYENVFVPVYFVYLSTLRSLGNVDKGETPYPDDIPENMRNEGLKAFMDNGRQYLTSVNGVGLSVSGFIDWVEDGENRLELKDMSKVADKNRETLSSVYDENVKEAGATWDKSKTEWASGEWGKAAVHTLQATGQWAAGAAETSGSWLGYKTATSRGWRWWTWGAPDRTVPDMVFDRRFNLYGLKEDPSDIRGDVEDLETAFRKYLEGASRGEKLSVLYALFDFSDELDITDDGYRLYISDLKYRNKTDVLREIGYDDEVRAFGISIAKANASNQRARECTPDERSRIDFVLYWFQTLFAPIYERFLPVIREATGTGPNEDFDVTDIKIGDAHDPQEIAKICEGWWRQFDQSLGPLKNIHIEFSEAGLKEFVKGKEEYEAKKDTGEELSAAAKAYANLQKSQKDAEVEAAKKSTVENLGENAIYLAGNKSLMSSLEALDNSTEDLKKFKAERLTKADEFILELGGRLEDGTNLHGEDLLMKVLADAWGLTAVNANIYNNYRNNISGFMKVLVGYLWKDKRPEFDFKALSKDELAKVISGAVYSFLTATGCLDAATTDEKVFVNNWWRNYFCEWFVRRVLCTFFYFASLYYKQTGAEIGTFIDISKLSSINGIDADDIILYFSKKCKEIVGSYTYLIPNFQSWERYRKRKGMYTSEELAAKKKEQQDLADAWDNNDAIIVGATQGIPKNAADPNTASTKAAQVVQKGVGATGSVAGLNASDLHVNTSDVPKSPTKYANGGIVENLGGFVTEQTSILGGAGIAGEAGPEAIIPLTRPNRARFLLDKTAQMLNNDAFNFKKFNSTVTRFFKNPNGAIYELANRLRVDQMTSEDILRSMFGMQLTNMAYTMRGSLDGRKYTSGNNESEGNNGPEGMTDSNGNGFMNWFNAGKEILSDMGSKAWNSIKDTVGSIAPGLKDSPLLDTGKKILTTIGGATLGVFQAAGNILMDAGTEKVSISGTSKSQLELAKKIWDYFLRKGWTKEGVAGMLGNLHAESRISNYRKQGDLSADLAESVKYTKASDADRDGFVRDSIGYGLAQWTYPTRKAALWDFTHGNKKSISDENCQIEFLDKELEGGIIKKSDLNALKTSKNVAEACVLFMMKFENPKDKSEEKQRERVAYAMQWYEQLKNSSDSSDEDFDNNSNLITEMLNGKSENAADSDSGINSNAQQRQKETVKSAGGNTNGKSKSSGSGNTKSAGGLNTAEKGTDEAPINVNASDLDKLITKGSGVDTARLKPDFAKRVAATAKDYLEQTRKKLVVTSAFRTDKKQAELWVRKNKCGDAGIKSVNKPQKAQTIVWQGKKYDVPGGGPGTHGYGTAVDFSENYNNLPLAARIAAKYGLYQPYPNGDCVHFEARENAKPLPPDGTSDESTKESIKEVKKTAKEAKAQEKKAEASVASSTDVRKQIVTERMPVTNVGVPTFGSNSGLQSISSPVVPFSTDTSIAGNVNNVDMNAEAQITEMRNSTDLLTQIRDILGAISKTEPAAVAAPAEPSKSVAMNGVNADISEAIRQGFGMVLQDIDSKFKPANMMAMSPSPAQQGSSQRSISSPVSFSKRS